MRVAAGEVLEQGAALVGGGDDPAVVGEQAGEPLRGDVLGEQPRLRRRLELAEPGAQLVDPLLQAVGVELAVAGGRVDEVLAALVEDRVRDLRRRRCCSSQSCIRCRSSVRTGRSAALKTGVFACPGSSATSTYRFVGSYQPGRGETWTWRAIAPATTPSARLAPRSSAAPFSAAIATAQSASQPGSSAISNGGAAAREVSGTGCSHDAWGCPTRRRGHLGRFGRPGTSVTRRRLR